MKGERRVRLARLGVRKETGKRGRWQDEKKRRDRVRGESRMRETKRSENRGEIQRMRGREREEMERQW